MGCLVSFTKESGKQLVIAMKPCHILNHKLLFKNRKNVNEIDSRLYNDVYIAQLPLNIVKLIIKNYQPSN